jgi:hypothetical protein
MINFEAEINFDVSNETFVTSKKSLTLTVK